MPRSATHQDAALAMLMLAENLVYLITDSEFNIQFASPEAARYGMPAQGDLMLGPAWLHALRPDLTKLFDSRSLFSHTALDKKQRCILIQAQVIDFEGARCLMMLLRRTQDKFDHPAPYDAATGLYSASFIENKIDAELERIKRFPSVFSLLALNFDPAPQPLTPLGDLLRIHFRAVDIVGHATRGGFLALLPGTTRDQARLAGARLATLAEDFRSMLPTPISVRYTAIEAIATDTRAALFARLYAAELIVA